MIGYFAKHEGAVYAAFEASLQDIAFERFLGVILFLWARKHF